MGPAATCSGYEVEEMVILYGGSGKWWVGTSRIVKNVLNRVRALMGKQKDCLAVSAGRDVLG